jgi:selenide,water dikinase
LGQDHSTALKFERAPEETKGRDRSMITLNRLAAEARSLPPAVHACTDVTGFGLIGHASEMAAASHCTLEIDAAAIPLLPGVLALVHGNVPGGGRTNVQHFGSETRISTDLDPELVQLLYDPQTSGGLLVALHADHAGEAANALHAAGFLRPESAACCRRRAPGHGPVRSRPDSFSGRAGLHGLHASCTAGGIRRS